VILDDILPATEGERTYTLADRRDGECAWPMGKTRAGAPAHGLRFCCDQVEPGSPYCPGHTWDALHPRRRTGPRPETVAAAA
jgi:hypothetical protein